MNWSKIRRKILRVVRNPYVLMPGVFALLVIGALLTMTFSVRAAVDHEIAITFSDDSGDSARFWVFNAEGTFTQVATGTMTEDSLGEGLYLWKTSVNLTNKNLVRITGYIKSGDPPRAEPFNYYYNPVTRMLIDSVDNFDNWVMHQSTGDSTYNLLLQTFDSMLIVLDSLETLDNWVMHQSTGDSLHDSVSAVYQSLFNPTTDSVMVDVSVANAASNLIQKFWEYANRALTDKAGFALSTAAITSLLEHDTSLITSGFGLMIKKWNDSIDATVSSGGSSAAIADADMASIADTIKNRGANAFLEAFWAELAQRADSGATGSSVWSTGDRDSVLAALTDAAMDDKIWVKALVRTLSSFGFSVSLSSGQPTNVAESTFVAFITEAREDNFKADISGLSTFDPALDSVLPDMSVFNAGLDNDTTVVDFLRLAAAGGAETWSTAQRDSLLNYISDAAKALLANRIADSTKNDADAYKADVTGLSTHDPAAVYSYFTSGSNEDVFKASGFVTPANLDTLAMWLGLHSSARAITHYQTDSDTVFVYSGSDLLGRMVFYHTGGQPGGSPDSVVTTKVQ